MSNTTVTTKTCTMCGEHKPIIDFRTQKQGGKEYTRPYCKVCEAIEGRRQYLLSIPNPDAETYEKLQAELADINELYRLRQEAGLKTFGTRKAKSAGPIAQHIKDQLAKLGSGPQ